MEDKEKILDALSKLESKAYDIREMADPDSNVWSLLDDIRTFIEETAVQIEEEFEED